MLSCKNAKDLQKHAKGCVIEYQPNDSQPTYSKINAFSFFHTRKPILRRNKFCYFAIKVLKGKIFYLNKRYNKVIKKYLEKV